MNISCVLQGERSILSSVQTVFKPDQFITFTPRNASFGWRFHSDTSLNEATKIIMQNKWEKILIIRMISVLVCVLVVNY